MTFFSKFVPSVPSGFKGNNRQAETLNTLINKHIQDETLLDYLRSDDFSRTATERGIARWEHAHLIAALDTLNAYQRDRKARPHSMGPAIGRQYQKDPRTRFIELLKRWLRTHAANTNMEEDDVRAVAGLCRDVLNHAAVFPSRNPRSFIHTIAEVYEHVQWQLREVLGRDRSCAEMVERALMLSRNLLSDAIGYLLLAATDLKQTDSLPSMEAVALWHSLPQECQEVLPGRADATLQKGMKAAWQTSCGAIVASLLSYPLAVRLFAGRAGEIPAAGLAVTNGGEAGEAGEGALEEKASSVSSRIAKANEDFAVGRFKTSGLAGPFRKDDKRSARQNYLDAATNIFDLAYLLGGAFVQFHRVGDGLGDYGMIRMAPWLHPFLKVLESKVKQLKVNLEQLNSSVEDSLVLAKARGVKVEGPVPTARMCARAHEAIERAVIGKESHAASLLLVFEKLRARSAPERLPQVMDALNDACTQLQSALTSEEFRLRVGDIGVQDFPRLLQAEDQFSGPPAGKRQAALTDGQLELHRKADALHSGVVAVDSAPEVSSSGTCSASTASLRQDSRTKPPGGAPAGSWSFQPDPRGAQTPSKKDAPLGTPSSGRTGTARQRSASAGSSQRPSPSNGSPNPFREEEFETEGEDEGAATSLSPGAVKTGSYDTVASAGDPAGDGESNSGGGANPFDTDVRREATAAAAAAGGETERKQEPIDDLRAQVWRCTSKTRGFKRHDRRMLWIADGRLHICEKGSMTAVKSAVDLERDVSSCQVLPGKMLSLHMRRVSRGEEEHKSYFFEFPEADLAEKFHAEIARGSRRE